MRELKSVVGTNVAAGMVRERSGSAGDAADADDLALFRRVKARDRAAFAQLYTRYHARLRAFVAGVVQAPDLVDEVVNDVMLAVWNGAGRFEGRSRLATWILGIAYRQALKAQRRSANRRETGWDSLAELASDEQPEDGVTQAQLRLRVGRALAGLSLEHRAVVTLTFFHGYSYGEISAIVGCPTNTVKTRMFHAREQLRRLLPRDELPRGPLE